MAKTATRTTRTAAKLAPEVPTFVPPVGETGLTTGTVVPPVDPATPKAGDNSGEFLDPKVIHAAIDKTLHDLIDLERQIDHERQRMAAQLLTRHHYLRSTDATTPSLDDLAMNAYLVGAKIKQPDGKDQPATYSGYLSTLVREFAGDYVPAEKQTTDEMRAQARYRARINTRLDRALRLLCNISWLGKPTVTRWDEASGRWFVPAIAFVPHGWHPSGQMLLNEDKTLRDGVWLEPDEDTKLSCYISPLTGNNRPYQIVQSLTQLEHAITSQLAAAHAGETATAAAATKAAADKLAAEKAVADKAAADAASATRAPQMPGTRNAATPAGDTTPEGDDDDAETPAPTGKAGRDFYVKELNQHVVAIHKILATGLQLDRADFTPDTWNSLVEDIVVLIRTLPTLRDGIKQASMQMQADKAKAAGRAA